MSKQPQPDYGAIASMETPIWGQSFEHAGAPEPVIQQAGARCGHGEAWARGLCENCYRAYLYGRPVNGEVAP